jgi:hypothetical protein
MGRSEAPDPSPRYLKSGALEEWLEVYDALHGPRGHDSVLNLPGVRPNLIGRLEDAGIASIADIPDDFDLTPTQTALVALVKSGVPSIDGEKIRTFLDQLTYPLYFLDYETFTDAVPVFDGTRPWQQVPFQYSLHIQHAPGAELEHREFLHTEASNPVPALLRELHSDIGDRGSIIVWYDAFETGRNSEMGVMSPEHAAFLDDLNARTVDLRDPFKNGWYSDGRFLGSSSIKKVLPVLVPDLSYDALRIQDGSNAQLQWMDVVLNGALPEQRERVFDDLRRYCHLDTLAMVRIFQHLSQRA